MAVISRIYDGRPDLLRILTTHSRAVADMALQCIDSRNLPLDRDFVEQAALLHDIGIIATDAPGILCTGAEPYIRHGIIGRDMLLKAGLPRHARVCATHTGAGLSADDIARQNLPLPHADFLPATPEEMLICYADKFYSKSGDLTRRKTLARVREMMSEHGADTLRRFEHMHSLFGLE